MLVRTPFRSMIFLATLALASQAVTAEVYKWKDENGRTHFSDAPPPNVDAKPTRITAAPKYAPSPAAPSSQSAPAAASAPSAASAPAAAQSGPKTLAEREAEMKQRRAAEQEAEAKKKEEAAKAAEKAKYCDGLRNELKALEAGGRVSRVNAQGEREFLDDAQMAKDAARVRGQIARDCNK